jgi:hypothetical protein
MSSIRLRPDLMCVCFDCLRKLVREENIKKRFHLTIWSGFKKIRFRLKSVRTLNKLETLVFHSNANQNQFWGTTKRVIKNTVSPKKGGKYGEKKLMHWINFLHQWFPAPFSALTTPTTALANESLFWPVFPCPRRIRHPTLTFRFQNFSNEKSIILIDDWHTNLIS